MIQSSQLKHGIKATTVTAGGGSLSLSALAGFMLPLARFSAGNSMSYELTDGSSREWGIGTVQASNIFDRPGTVTGTEVGGVYTSGGSPLTLSGGLSVLECILHEGTVLDKLAYLDATQAFTKGQSGDFIPLTSSGESVAISLDDGNNFSHTLTENTTLAAATGVAITNTQSESGIVYIKQHHTTPHTFAFNAFWKFKTAFSMTATLDGLSGFSYTTRPDGSAADCVQFL